MMMLTKLTCALKVTFFYMKVGLTDTKEGDSEDTHCDKRKEGYFEVH